MTEQDKSYLVASLTKEDLFESFPEYANCIDALSDGEMAKIVDRLSAAIMETYSVALPIILSIHFEGKECTDDNAIGETTPE